MCCELYGWFERDSKNNLTEKDLKALLRKARRHIMTKHKIVPNLLTVRKDEYREWMSKMGISVKQTEHNLAPRHFTLEFVETL